jgi:hypothetical protein
MKSFPTRTTAGGSGARWLRSLCALASAACGGTSAATPGAPAVATLQTRAEASGYTVTSSQADVLAFLDSLQSRGAMLGRGIVARTTEGRVIPYVVVSRPLLDSPAAARASGRPIVYVQGNIHSGEVEGKEAMQAMLRDLLSDPRPNVLDSLVLIVVPNYNADGNEKLDSQRRNRGAQNGPEMVGTRANAQSLNLNRDYMKADAPETRGSLRMFTTWDPHVFVDLHTTNGSYHGYNLTWAPSLNPAGELPSAAFGAAYARDSLLPAVQERTLARRRIATFPYGNFAQDEGGPGSAPRSWRSYDHRPRFGTNYFALRGRIGVLTEAYSHDPFRKRVEATYAFVAELLSLIAERSPSILAHARAADAGVAALSAGSAPRSVPIRARLTATPRMGEVVYEVLEPSTDSARREPGVRAGMRRTGRFITERMPIHDRFETTRARPVPYGYAIHARDTAAINLLALHGVMMHRTTSDWTGDAGPQFVPDTTIIAPRPSEGRREVRLEGRWVSIGSVMIPAGTVIVRTAQPLGVLAIYLLEPESDDGLVAWDVGSRSAGTVPAVTRLAGPPAVGMTPVPRP